MHQQANETESEVDVPEPRIAPDSSRVDEPLEAETTSILPAAPEEPQSEKTEPLPTDEGGPFPASVSLEAIESRSLLAISLRPSAFPGDRARLLQVARDEDAEERVIAQLETLPVTDLFMNVQHVWEALGGDVEHRDAPPAVEPHLHAPPVSHEAETQPVRPEGTVRADDMADGSAETPLPLLARVVGVAVAGTAITVGMAVGAVRALRRRL